MDPSQPACADADMVSPHMHNGAERHHHRSHSIPTRDATRCEGRTGARQFRVTRWTCSAHLIDALVLAWYASPPPRLVSALRVDSAEGRASAAVKCGTSSAVAEAFCDQVTRGTSRRTLIGAASRARQLSPRARSPRHDSKVCLGGTWAGNLCRRQKKLTRRNEKSRCGSCAASAECSPLQI